MKHSLLRTYINKGYHVRPKQIILTYFSKYEKLLQISWGISHLVFQVHTSMQFLSLWKIGLFVYLKVEMPWFGTWKMRQRTKMNVLLLVKNGDFIRAKWRGGQTAHLLGYSNVCTGKNVTMGRAQGTWAAKSLRELMTTEASHPAWAQADPPPPSTLTMNKCILK